MDLTTHLCGAGKFWISLRRTAGPGPGGVDGKVLPVAERHFKDWNTNPRQINYPSDGRQLASSTVVLLSCYMGLYHGFIEKPRWRVGLQVGVSRH